MATEQPTQEQIREFWEWCGFKWENAPAILLGGERITEWKGQPTGHWLNQEGKEIDRLPPIDPNNLFEYAVPKLGNYEMYRGLEPGRAVYGRSVARVWEIDSTHSEIAYADTPALALFWAIWKLKEWR